MVAGEWSSIPTRRLVALEKAANMLECLEEGGVDNWEWYGKAVDLYNTRYGSATNE